MSEILSFGITDPAFNDPASEEFNPSLLPHDLSRGGALFHFNGKKTGSEYTFFIQDAYSFVGFTATMGIRYDNYNFVLDRDHWSPRVGLAYNIAPTQTVLRISYNRLFQTPSNETLLLSTSEEATTLVPPDRIAKLGTASILIEPERVNLYEVGLQQSAGRWFRVDASYYWKRILNFHDNDQFLNTTVVFPASIQSGTVNGFDLRVGFQFEARNLTDQQRLFNFLSVFSGTHVIAPRTFAARTSYYF